MKNQRYYPITEEPQPNWQVSSNPSKAVPESQIRYAVNQDITTDLHSIFRNGQVCFDSNSDMNWLWTMPNFQVNQATT